MNCSVGYTKSMVHVDSDSARCRRETKNRRKRKGNPKKKRIKKSCEQSQYDRSQRRQEKKKRRKKKMPKSMTGRSEGNPSSSLVPRQGLVDKFGFCPINVQRLSSCTPLHICASQMGQDRTDETNPRRRRGT